MKERIKGSLIGVVTLLSQILMKFGNWAYKIGQSLRLRSSGLLIPLSATEKDQRVTSRTAGKGESSKVKLNHCMKICAEMSVISCNDIGCYHGLYAIEMAKVGMWVQGYEIDPFLVRLGREVIDEQELSNVAIYQIKISPDNISTIRSADCTLLLSVYHWWVMHFGWERAEKMLHQIWKKTGKILFFEIPNTVQNKKIAKWMPDMGCNTSEAEGFIRQTLLKLPNSDVELLDFLDADFRLDEKRHLFAVRKK